MKTLSVVKIWGGGGWGGGGGVNRTGFINPKVINKRYQSRKNWYFKYLFREKPFKEI